MSRRSKFAVERLWKLWQGEQGGAAQSRLWDGSTAMAAGHYEQARVIFDGLAADFPEWVEAVNMQAALAFRCAFFGDGFNNCLTTVRLVLEY